MSKFISLDAVVLGGELVVTSGGVRMAAAVTDEAILDDDGQRHYIAHTWPLASILVRADTSPEQRLHLARILYEASKMLTRAEVERSGELPCDSELRAIIDARCGH